MAPVNMNWTTRPQDQIDAAKTRVRDTMHEANPKLTTLEKAFRASALRQKRQPPSRQYGQPLV